MSGKGRVGRGVPPQPPVTSFALTKTQVRRQLKISGRKCSMAVVERDGNSNEHWIFLGFRSIIASPAGVDLV
jgi:hypothetical protein